MNWLITGGCGFIGTNLIAHVLERHPGSNVRVLDNLSVGTREDLAEVTRFRETSAAAITGGPRGVELVVGDIRDYETCLQSALGVEAIVHLAANTGVAPSVEDPRLDMECNVIGTFNMLEAARVRGARGFVFASSGAPVGEVEPPIHEEKAPKPVSPYGASKLAGEGYCSAYWRTFGLKTVSLRFGNVYGPRSKNKQSVVARFMRRALTGKPLEIYGDGNQTRDFIYINDLIQAILLALRLESGGEVFQIATYAETTINKLVHMITCIIKSETGMEISILNAKPRLGDVKRNYSDISKARMVLGYDPQYTLEVGLHATLQYFLNRADSER
jgi:UDP-glucose 4-epimerase